MKDHWLYQVGLDKNGYYQRCNSCEWVGKGLRSPVERCPECKSAVDPDAALVRGSLKIWVVGGRFILWNDRFSVKVERSEAAEVVKFMTQFR